MAKMLFIPTSPRVMAALERLARREHRRIHDQAALILERGLKLADGERVSRPATQGEAAGVSTLPAASEVRRVRGEPAIAEV